MLIYWPFKLPWNWIYLHPLKWSHLTLYLFSKFHSSWSMMLHDLDHFPSLCAKSIFLQKIKIKKNKSCSCFIPSLEESATSATYPLGQSNFRQQTFMETTGEPKRIRTKFVLSRSLSLYFSLSLSAAHLYVYSVICSFAESEIIFFAQNKLFCF